MKICEMLKKKDVGAIGIGAMIVFIAMVLVAGIAASVLIQTSGKLEMQAMKSGQETIAEVATGIAVEKIEGWNNSGYVYLMAIEVRPRAGSADIDLSEAVVEISDSSTKNLFTYNTTRFTESSGINGDLLDWDFFPVDNGTTFCVTVLEDADESCSSTNPVINSGDHVILGVNVSYAFSPGFSTRTDVIGQVIPEEGSSGVISFTTPAAYNDAVLELQ